MEFLEANPLPEVCQNCTEPDCDVCDHGLERWLLSPENEAALKLKLFRQGLKRKSTVYLLAMLRREMDKNNVDRIDALVVELNARADAPQIPVEVEAVWEDFAENWLGMEELYPIDEELL